MDSYCYCVSYPVHSDSDAFKSPLIGFLKRQRTYSSLVFSDFSICSALLMTSTIICCSEEVNGSGCLHWLIVAVLTDQPEWSLNTDDDNDDNRQVDTQYVFTSL